MRRAGVDDAEILLDIQRSACVAGLPHIYPPDLYPFPSETILDELRAQLADPAYVALVDGDGRGFVLVGHSFLERLYVRPEAWGVGLAVDLHAAALEQLRGATASLWCLADNTRARRFYEREGWTLNGDERVVPYPPHPLDVGYSIDLG